MCQFENIPQVKCRTSVFSFLPLSVFSLKYVKLAQDFLFQHFPKNTVYYLETVNQDHQIQAAANEVGLFINNSSSCCKAPLPVLIPLPFNHPFKTKTALYVFFGQFLPFNWLCLVNIFMIGCIQHRDPGRHDSQNVSVSGFTSILFFPRYSLSLGQGSPTPGPQAGTQLGTQPHNRR